MKDGASLVIRGGLCLQHRQNRSCESDLIAVASEYNWDHAPLRIIVHYFTEVNTAADLVSDVTLWTKRTTMSVRLEQSTRTHRNVLTITSVHRLVNGTDSHLL